MKVKSCMFCRHLKSNPKYDYIENPDVSICDCDIESEFWEGDINAVLGGAIGCEDYEEEE